MLEDLVLGAGVKTWRIEGSSLRQVCVRRYGYAASRFSEMRRCILGYHNLRRWRCPRFLGREVLFISTVDSWKMVEALFHAPY